MKFKVYILFIYLVTLTVLPSVRAMKLQFGETSEQACNSSEPIECDKGKLVMSLNFSPIQFVNELNFIFKQCRSVRSFFKSIVVEISSTPDRAENSYIFVVTNLCIAKLWKN